MTESLQVLIDALALDPLLRWTVAAALAILLAHAAVSKLMDLPMFEQHLSVYGVPMALMPLARLAVPALELVAAMLLLTPWRSIGAAMTLVLLCSYAALMAWHLARGHVLDCGCGGEPLPVRWALVLRNLGLAALAGFAGGAVPARALGLADFAVLSAAVALAALLYATLNQTLRHQAGSPHATALRKSPWMH